MLSRFLPSFGLPLLHESNQEGLFVNGHFFKGAPEKFVVLNSTFDSKSPLHLFDKLIPPRDLNTESCAGNSQCLD